MSHLLNHYPFTWLYIFIDILNFLLLFFLCLCNLIIIIIMSPRFIIKINFSLPFVASHISFLLLFCWCLCLNYFLFFCFVIFMLCGMIRIIIHSLFYILKMLFKFLVCPSSYLFCIIQLSFHSFQNLCTLCPL